MKQPKFISEIPQKKRRRKTAYKGIVNQAPNKEPIKTGSIHSYNEKKGFNTE
jgi:hypothetical protein